MRSKANWKSEINVTVEEDGTPTELADPTYTRVYSRTCCRIREVAAAAPFFLRLAHPLTLGTAAVEARTGGESRKHNFCRCLVFLGFSFSLLFRREIFSAAFWWRRGRFSDTELSRALVGVASHER